MVRLTDETALLAFSVFQAWFGPPPAEFRGELIDGRIRVRVCAAVGARSMSARVLETPEAAVRWLLVAGHIDRAHALCAASAIPVDDLLAVRLGLPPYAVAPVRVAGRRRTHRRDKSRGVQCRVFLELARSAVEQNRVVFPEEIFDAFQESV
jgi:hypothetical protein